MRGNFCLQTDAGRQLIKAGADAAKLLIQPREVGAQESKISLPSDTPLGGGRDLLADGPVKVFPHQTTDRAPG